jgi:DNA-binding NtrC family response regulator
MSSLLVTHGHHFGVRYPLLDTSTIGRSSGCTIQLLDEKVSRLHSTILRTPEGWVLRDEGSSNGTGLNGRLLLEPATLRPGDEVAVGNNLMLFESELEILRDLEGSGSVILAAPNTGTASTPVQSPGSAQPVIVRVEAILAGVAEMLAGPRGLGRPAALVEAAARGLGADHAALLLAPIGGEALRAVATYPHRGRVTISRAFIQRVLDQKSPHRSADGIIELVVRSGRTLVETHPGATLAVPISRGGRLRGVFFAESASHDAFAGLPLDVLSSLLAVTFAPLLSGDPRDAHPAPEPEPVEYPVAESPAMAPVVHQARTMAESGQPVLLLGEPGSGRGFLARWMHRLGPRSQGPFHELHCGGLLEANAESVLFGHEKGAVAGADAARPGLLEEADGGTLLLDEVGELGPSLQTKLLRALQEGRYYRVGGTRPVRVDVRLMAGSSRDLGQLVRHGSFRVDLHHALDALHLELPPLKLRIADIEPLTRRFVAAWQARHGLRVKGFAPEAVGLLEGHSWPLNVAELRDVVERCLLRSAGDSVEARDVEAELHAGNSADAQDPGMLAERAQALSRLERERIARALGKSRGNALRAAALLGCGPATLQRLCAIYELDAYGQ